MLDYKKEEFLPYHQFTISLQFAFVGQRSVLCILIHHIASSNNPFRSSFEGARADVDERLEVWSYNFLNTSLILCSHSILKNTQNEKNR